MSNKRLIEDISKLIASTILTEEDEAYRQAALTKKIDNLKLRAKDSDKEETITDEQDEDPFAGDEEEEPEEESEEEPEEESEEEPEEESGEGDDQKKKKPEDFQVAPPEDIPAKVTISQVEKQINNLRAGKSLKDEAIADELQNYFEDLGEGEKQALFVYLASLASILTGGSAGDIAPSPEMLDVDIEPEDRNRDKVVDDEVIVVGNDTTANSPIVVGESADIFNELMFVFEQSAGEPHRCLSGKTVKFGSPDCVNDLDNRIDDASYQRDSLTKSSADRAALNGTLKFLRQKKRKAEKIRQQDEQMRLQSKINLSDEL